MHLARLIGPELETLLAEEPSAVRALLDEIHPEDIADLVDALDDQRAGQLLAELPVRYAGQVFARLDQERQLELTALMGVARTSRIAVEMEGDDRADFVRALPATVGAALLRELERSNPEVAREVESLARWPESSAGGLMTPEYWAVGPEVTVGDALLEIRRNAEAPEVLDVIYVVDQADHLSGQLTIRDAVIRDPDTPIAQVMRHNVISVPPEMDQEEVARIIGKYDLSCLPVVDAEGRMLGLVTTDDIIDVLREEADEDAQRMGGIRPIEDTYFNVSFGTFILKRAPWVLVLFIGGFLTAMAMEAFDRVLSVVTQIAFYIPMLISAGGNTGSQSSTLIIRSLAVGDVTLRDWWRVLLRELAIGLTLGGILAAVGVTRVLVGGSDLGMAALIGITVTSIVVIGCLIGSMMPLVLHRLGVDPATSSTPFIATIIDVLGVVIYLGLAQWILADVLARAALGLEPSL
ncbi:MAG: magnesium transporter [Polyangiaceae bacterium]|nr:magnesium transporter [Polyangiaceae bacterium]